jgi:putative membrane protein
MNPQFTLLLISVIVFALIVLWYISWRFGLANAIAFLILSGGFTAVMDMLSAYVEVNYEYPGKTPLWVFCFIFFGWTSICGSCVFIAEGIVKNPSGNLLTQKSLWWKVPLLTAIFALVLDLFIDPIAVETGYWVWFVKGEIYYEIPMLNFIGWFVLMLCAPMAWIFVIRRINWKGWQRVLLAFGLFIPLMIGSGILSLSLNGLFRALNLR